MKEKLISGVVTLINNIANLFKVKTLVTIAVIYVFCVLAIRGSIMPDNVLIVVSNVIAFYFGTQLEKNSKG